MHLHSIVFKMVFLAGALAFLPIAYSPDSPNVIPDHLQYSRTLTSPQSPGLRGQFNGFRKQKEIINHVVNFCGEDLMLYHNPKNRQYLLVPILQEARDQIEPSTSIRQVRRWFNFWIDYAETPLERKLCKKNYYKGKKHYKTLNVGRRGLRWNAPDSIILRHVLINYPALYMEEIKTQVLIFFWEEMVC